MVAIQPRTGLTDADRLGQSVQAQLLIQAVEGRAQRIEVCAGRGLIQVRVDEVAALLPAGSLQAGVTPYQFLTICTLVVRAAHRRVVQLLTAPVQVHQIAVAAGLILQLSIQHNVIPGRGILHHPVLLIVEVGDFLIGHALKQGGVKEHARVGEITPRCHIPERVRDVTRKISGDSLTAPLQRVGGQILHPRALTGDARGTGSHQLSRQVLTLDGHTVLLLQCLVAEAAAQQAVTLVLLLVGLLSGFLRFMSRHGSFLSIGRFVVLFLCICLHHSG